MLGNVYDFVIMTAVLATVAVAMHIVTSLRAHQSDQLIFEEDLLPEIVSLKLNQ